ncbi:MAG: 2-phospho-L-lactate guanylyltransferase [bacterium]|nr:2-phospho-L-lactate guanylyltransferase [bacterium]
MSVWVIIPVKPFRLAKSRLADVLTPDERQRFAESMLRHVLSVVRSVPQVTGTLVISRDTHALAIARDYGAKTVQESGAPELNAALRRATSIIGSWRADAILILPADLPLLAPSDVAAMIDLGRDDHSVVIATDRNEDGTNALFVRPPGLINYAYGPGSFRRHAVLGRDAGAVISTYSSEGLLQDIDLPEDVDNYHRVVRRSHLEDLLPTFRDLNSHTKEK